MSISNSTYRVIVTGANGLLGYHARAAILAENCAADFKREVRQYEFVDSPRLTAESLGEWSGLVESADLVLHLAGINRAEPDEVENGNRNIAELLVSALTMSASKAHVVYANSTHAGTDSAYGRGKQAADKVLQAWAEANSVFGENARSHYNNVTATLCQQVARGEEPTIHDGAKVELLHAGEAIDAMFAAFHKVQIGSLRLDGKSIFVSELYNILLAFRAGYQCNMYPDLSDPFLACLFNSYRTVEYPESFPKELVLHSDQRGTLFEAVKGGGGGQTFLSWTEPGVERGNHFHRRKIERFLVVSGSAEIRLRPLFEDRVDTFAVSGDNPVYVDMPTLHTHSIVNTGSEPLLTLFWAHEIFDPDDPDTFAHLVIQK